MEKMKAIVDLNDKLEQAIATEQFDKNRLSIALLNVQREEKSRIRKGTREALEQAEQAAAFAIKTLSKLD